jgi:hypothetical protein
MPKVKIGIVGSRFQADCIAGSLKSMQREAEVVAVASPRQATPTRSRGNTTPSQLAGGSFILAEGKTSVTVTTRGTHNAGKTGSASRTFAISPVGDGQLLSPIP